MSERMLDGIHQQNGHHDARPETYDYDDVDDDDDNDQDEDEEDDDDDARPETYVW